MLDPDVIEREQLMNEMQMAAQQKQSEVVQVQPAQPLSKPTSSNFNAGIRHRVNILL